MVVDENNQPTVDTDTFKAAFTNLSICTNSAIPWTRTTSLRRSTTAAPLRWQSAGRLVVPTADSAASYTVIPTKLTDTDTAKNTSMYGVWTIGICNNSQNRN
jgi:hypothetical protein